MRALASAFLALLAFAAAASGGTLSGTIRDAESGAPLAGANVRIDGTPFGAVSDPRGTFTVTGIPAGRYTVTASFVGYTVAKTRVAVNDAPTELSLALAPVVLPGQSVVVTATRAKDRETPVTFSNLPRGEIRSRYTVQDVPMLLQSMPSTHAYSDAGNGVGYSYLSIRGFGQKRINVLINGIPHNGPTSHEVYWVDLPDLLANAADVQVQRGVGSSLYGSSALGGSVNVITSTYGTEREIALEAGAGSFATRKYSFAFNSGLVDNSYIMYGRFSRITSDGYRDRSWTRLWAYSLGVARYGERSTIRFQTYGGPEQTHLAYYGIPREYIDGAVTGDARKDRRYNPLTYAEELDNFNQPHYELHAEWQPADDLDIENTLYTIRGKGSYDQFRAERSLVEFRLPTFSVADPNLYPAEWYATDDAGNPVADGNGMYTVEKSDLIRSRWVANAEYGWLPRVRWEHGDGALTVGGEVRRHEGHHWGLITWLSAAPPSIGPDHTYYRFRERKLTLSAFVHELYRLTPAISLMGDVQAVDHTYALDRDTVTRYAYEAGFRWLAPKAGINVNLTDRINVFANVAWAKREPVTTDLVDPQDYWSEPNFARRDTLRTPTGSVREVRLRSPEVEPESMWDVELGTGFRSSRLSVSANLYMMDFRNEIVPWAGQISDASGLPITGNADRSVHRGIEVEATARPVAFLALSGNVSVNDDHFVRYTENAMDWDAYVPVPVVRDGNRIAGFPTMLANLRGEVTHGGFTAALMWRRVGRQYLDNAEDVANSVAPYHVTDLSFGYRFGRSFGMKGLEVRVQVNNLFDRLYEASGYVDDVYAVAAEGKVYGTPYYIPAATRNTFVGLRWEW